MEPELQIITANAVPVREETLNGRTYIVAKATLIVPGVLNGSRGPLYYPEDEVVKNPGAWNAMPMVLGHPADESGRNISARSPNVLEQYGLGWLFNSTAPGKLETETWFDKELTRRKAPDAYAKLAAGKPIELSTGLMTENFPADPGATFNGVPYIATARNYQPDHLAVLLNERGACSINDGCGVLVNTLGGELPMKKTIIDWLTTNCECWKVKGSKELLETFDEKRLKQFQVNAQAAMTVNKARAVVNADDAGGGDVASGVSIADLATFLGITTDPAADPVGFIKEITTSLSQIQTKLGAATDPAEPDADDAAGAGMDASVAMSEGDNEDDMTGNKNKGKAKVKPAPTATMKEMLAKATPQEQAVWNHAVQIEKNERLKIVRKLVANLEPAKANTVGKKLLKEKTLPELQEMLELQESAIATNSKKKGGAADEDDDDFPDLYFGGAGGNGGRTTNAAGDEDDVLMPWGVTNADPEDDDDEDLAPAGRKTKRR